MLIVLAGIGLALSILSHIAALFGKSGPLGKYTFLLHIGIFVVWLPAVLAARRLTSGFTVQQSWSESLRGCQPWMRYALYGFFCYAFVNFVVLTADAPPKGGSDIMAPATVRWFS